MIRIKSRWQIIVAKKKGMIGVVILFFF